MWLTLSHADIFTVRDVNPSFFVLVIIVLTRHNHSLTPSLIIMSPRSPPSSSDNDDHPVAAAHVQRAEHEASINRNPHPDFIRVQASRPDWSESHAASSSSSSWKFTKTRDPNWKWGQGGNDNGESLDKDHVEIDPYAPGRPSNFNYKLLISGIVPRPIGFYSTVSKDGELRIFP